MHVIKNKNVFLDVGKENNNNNKKQGGTEHMTLSVRIVQEREGI